MKLASLKHRRDGKLVVVSADLTRAAPAPESIPTMQAALDEWETAEPLLRYVSHRLSDGSETGFAFDETKCASPLPRAFQWADGSAFVNHVELVRKSRGADLPKSFWHDPLMYQGGSDALLAPHDPIILGSEDWGIDFEGEVAVILGDVPAGADREQAADAIKLVMLANDVSLRNLIPDELGKGFGFFQSKPASAFSPVAVTPDELGDSWDGGRLHLPLLVYRNNELFGRANAGEAMIFDFPTLIAHAAKTRALCAGTIIGSGTVSNMDPDGGPGRPVNDGGTGYSCISELRVVETIREGKPQSEYMKNGEKIRIEMQDTQRKSIFGAINQKVMVTKPQLS